MTSLELLNRTSLSQLPLPRLEVETIGIATPPMTWERLLLFPESKKSTMDWQRLLSLPETPPKPVMSILLPDRPRPLIVEADLSIKYPAHTLMNRILDLAAMRVDNRVKASARAMEAFPMPYIPPPEIQQIAAARRVLQEAAQVQTPAPIAIAEPQLKVDLRQRIKGILPSADTVNNVAFFIAANELARAVSYNLEGRLPINPILTYLGVHLLALGYLGVETFAEEYKAQSRKDAQLVVANTVRALPNKIIRYGVAGGTWSALTVLTQK